MGSVTSTQRESPLVRLCRERRDLIAAAAEHRYHLASAHVAYFRALRRVGDALMHFADEALTPPPGSPVLTIPSSEGKQRHGSRSVPTVRGVGGGSPSSSISLDEGSHLCLSEDEESSHLHLSSEGEEAEPVASTSTGYYYMKHSTGKPSTVYQSPIYPGQDQYGVAYGGYYYGEAGPSSAPVDPRSSYTYYDGRAPKPRSPPPPPPAPEAYGWDFLDPFGTYDEVYTRNSMGSLRSSSNSSEVRAREGIPDLEDETEQESLGGALKRRKGKEVEGSGGNGDGYRASTSEHAVDDAVDRGFDEKHSKESVDSECIASSASTEVEKPKCSGDGDVDFAAKKDVKFDVEEEQRRPSPEDVKSRMLSVEAALSTQGTRDIREVVREIRGLFNAATISGEELWSLLEVGKLRYRTRKAVLKVVSSRFLISLPVLTRSSSQLKYSRLSPTKTLKLVEASHGGTDWSTRSKFDLSSTIERLHVWEKKLYKEVKVEEKLRTVYDKKFKKLRALDEHGAESHEIDSAQASIRKLLTRIDMVVKSIDGISKRIQKLRDEELQPQISELISGLRTMWKTVLQCHQKQFQAIIDSRTHNLLAKVADRKSPVAKATMELEAAISQWLSCFSDWISTQKSYIRTLNGWLLMCLNVEPEVTPDGVVPFSPGRYGAPVVFITCNDWHQAMNGISGDSVSCSILNFAEGIHQLREKQNEEQQQKLKAEYLSRDYVKRLESLRTKGIPLQVQSFDENTTSVSSKTGASSEDRRVALDLMRKRLDEEKTKHGKALEQVHAAVSSSLRIGLIPIFDALCTFTSETSRAYDAIRQPRAS